MAGGGNWWQSGARARDSGALISRFQEQGHGNEQCLSVVNEKQWPCTAYRRLIKAWKMKPVLIWPHKKWSIGPTDIINSISFRKMEPVFSDWAEPSRSCSERAVITLTSVWSYLPIPIWKPFHFDSYILGSLQSIPLRSPGWTVTCGEHRADQKRFKDSKLYCYVHRVQCSKCKEILPFVPSWTAISNSK